MRRRTLPMLSLMVLATLWSAGPAWSHPFVEGPVAVDSISSMTLSMAHGCGEAQREPTTDVSLEVPKWLRIVDVPEPPDWAVELEGQDARVTVVTWQNPEATEPAPSFDVRVVADGDPGAELHLRVAQSCGEDGYRWIGTPDDPADNPAVNVTLEVADAQTPAPAEDELTPAERALAAGNGGAPTETPAPEEATDQGPIPEEVAVPTDAPQDASPIWPWSVLVAAVVLAGVAAVTWRRRRS